MRILDMSSGEKHYITLGTRVIAVLSRREDGWCMYIDAVPGISHDAEGQEVANSGDKLGERMARAIAENRGFDPTDCRYAQ